ncbi:MAG TPA: rhomboid family intramembrane serine protease [Thermoanaerobaculia bacterium]|nr:rhomboid family intramembrane serine protease [Thermoanaerobaculia bacterium]
MIPLRDINPRGAGVPFVNIALIIANILMFFWELSLGARLQGTIASIGFVPAEFFAGGAARESFDILTSMFLHGGWLHLGGNMLYLWIFGDNIEDRMGHLRYLVFYLVCGYAAALSHALFSASSTLPAIGASGAVAGVLGAYIVLFPRAHVMTLIPLGFFIAMRQLPALVVLGLWFVMQLFTGVASIGVDTAQTGGVAWFAHIGGFVAGLVLVFVFRRKQETVAFPRFE